MCLCSEGDYIGKETCIILFSKKEGSSEISEEFVQLRNIVEMNM